MEYSTLPSEHTIYIDPDAYEAAWRSTRQSLRQLGVLEEYYSLMDHDAACGIEHVACSRYRVVDARKWIITKLRYAW